jgi:nucleotide-binding universal stress UspA family protein
VATATQTTLFDRVVCGVDRSEAGATAARAAAVLTAADGSLTLVAVDDPSIAVHAGWGMPQILRELAEEAKAALERGRAEAEKAHFVESRLLTGDPHHCLLAEIARSDATLVALGSHGVSRATGIALGAVSTHLLHDAPCAVLIARAPVALDAWPRSIVVGIDGSEGSGRALEAARALADRFAARIRVIVATEHSHVDLDAAYGMAADLEEHEARPLEALTVASETNDLVVVGSRGLRGLRALGSLSERVAHDAHSSVLVVRPRDVAAA